MYHLQATNFGCAVMAIAKGSMARAHKRGDKGQPCLVTLNKGKALENRPFKSTCATGAWYSN